MKKLKSTIVFLLLLIFINSLHSQTLILTEPEQTDLQNLLMTNPTLKNEAVGTTINNAITAQTPEIVCEPIDDIFNLQCPRYQLEVNGVDDYTDAIELAIADANANGGGVILFPGNTIVKVTRNILMENNITFRASHSMATIKKGLNSSDSFSGSQLLIMSPHGNPLARENITFENIIFDGDNSVSAIVANGLTHTNINILNCTFQNTKTINTYGSGISLRDVADVTIKNCVFRDGNFGITLDNRNSRVRIENNKFEKSLTKNPIKIQGKPDGEFYSDFVWILNNDISIKRAESIIDSLPILERDVNTGYVDISLVNSPNDADYDEYDDWRWKRKGPSAIYITAGNQANAGGKNFHKNIFIENNVAVGPDYGFFDGGTADMYSLKDILRLQCNNNIARFSGDLGFAIERSSSVVFTGNTADRNNSFGMGIVDTRNSVFSNNILENNALRRNYIYNSSPYGGFVIAGKSFNNIIEGNHFFSYSTIDVSYADANGYTNRTNPTDFYGIVFRATYDDTGGGVTLDSPTANKIGTNHYSGHRWGQIYNQTPNIQITENLTATTFPKNQDYPLGTWIRNSNLNNSALGWSVINRVETHLYAQTTDLTLGDWVYDPNANSQNIPPIQVVDDSNTIQVGDIFGVMLDDGSIHWSEINSLSPQFGYYNVGLVQYPTVSITNDGVQDPSAKLIVQEGEVGNRGMNRIVILRWLTVTK